VLILSTEKSWAGIDPPISRPHDGGMESREKQLEKCIRRLLDTTELNMDDMEDETRQAIDEALALLTVASDSQGRNVQV
jgi:hypothetical protein